ncbi:DNA methyltransferase [Dietzia kunjamensis]|uniref:DNA methyltransferase n=1 Tax=Dietzia kunjamensis TaxID=322509 RepID=UPI0032AE95B1
MSATTLDRGQILQQLRIFSTHWSERIDGWRTDKVTGTESSFAQSFWSDLLACFGINAARIDLFEREAIRASTGNKGSIDVFQSGVFIGEAKSLGVDLDKANSQAQDYLAGGSVGQHEFPKYVVVTDFERIRIDQLGEGGSRVDFTIDQLPEHLDSMLFFAGHETVTRREQQDASIHAAQLMAQLYEAMVGDEADQAVGDDLALGENADDEDESAQRASMMLTRILFLLYGDDAGLWEADLFHRWVEQRTDAENLGAQLHSLFGVLNTPVDKRNKNLGDLLARFPYVNGALFADPMPLEYFTPGMRDALLAACRFRWTRISPAVFGAMFQLVKSKEARRAAGEHYTSETNILKTIGPLFLDEYRSRADRLIRNKSTTLGQLTDLQDELASNIYVDPACGSGNFLNLAYAKLREIETDLIVERRRRTGGTDMSLDVTIEQKLRIDRFHGFEINWWPAKIAETAMFLVDHQANLKMATALGQAPERLPIKITANIVHANALNLDWKIQLPKITGRTWVFGNPPFIGQKEKSETQVKEMKEVWGKKYDGYLDYVTAWHKKSIDLLHSRTGDFAFVSTNSICQGQPVPALFDALFSEGWRISFAHRTFSWDSQAPGKAAVHCVIVGFTRDQHKEQRLWTYDHVNGPPKEVRVEHGINAYLIDGPNVLVRKRMKPLSNVLPELSSGSKAVDWGFYTFDTPEELDKISHDPIAMKYIRLYIGGDELIKGEDRWCLWLQDVEPKDLTQSKVLRDRVSEVQRRRSESKRPATLKAAQTPHLFGEIRQPKGSYLGAPQTFANSRRYATVARLDASTIASIKLFTAPDPDGLLFAFLSSSAFLAWQKAVGGRWKSDPSLSNTIVWNNFPVPDLDAKTRKSIINAGKGVLAARDLHPGRSLADAYNPLAMDPKLVGAHSRLDREVDLAFGAQRKLTTERQRLELLFAKYAELINPASVT